MKGIKSKLSDLVRLYRTSCRVIDSLQVMMCYHWNLTVIKAKYITIRKKIFWHSEKQITVRKEMYVELWRGYWYQNNFLQKFCILSVMNIFKKKEFILSRKELINDFVEDRFSWRSVWNLARLDKQVDWIDFNLQWVFDFGKTRRCCQYGMSITLVYNVHCIATLICMKTSIASQH